MTISLRRLLLACPILYGAIAIALPQPAYGCSCRRPAPLDVALADSAAVFAGTVVGIDVTNPAYMTVTLDVGETWKGMLSQTIHVQTAPTSAICGYHFEQGEAYLVYAQQLGSQLRTTQCDRTSPLNQATQDIAILNAIR
ncbi:MAG: hypothetical protein WBA10_12910 [Elainellaceae cyanobacterium]